jgi:hypothetical protein
VLAQPSGSPHPGQATASFRVRARTRSTCPTPTAGRPLSQRRSRTAITLPARDIPSPPLWRQSRKLDCPLRGGVGSG